MLRSGNSTKLYWREWQFGSPHHWDLKVVNYLNDHLAPGETPQPTKQYVTCSKTNLKDKQLELPKNWYVVIH